MFSREADKDTKGIKEKNWKWNDTWTKKWKKQERNTLKRKNLQVERNKKFKKAG
jgi:hypothetical protein